MNAEDRGAKGARQRRRIRQGIVSTFTEIRRQEYGTDVHKSNRTLIFVLCTSAFPAWVEQLPIVAPGTKHQAQSTKFQILILGELRDVGHILLEKHLFDTPSTLDYASIVRTNVYGPRK